LSGEDVHGTQEYSDQPEFYDHSYLDLLNRRGISLGWGQMFDYIVPPSSEDNGEIFVSKYFEQQEKRNSTVGQDKKTKLCNCVDCQGYSPSKATVPRLPAEEQANNAVERVQQQQQEKVQNETQKISAGTVNFTVAAPILASLPPPFYSASYSMVPSNCCFGWYPFYCAKKQEYNNRKYHGGGRRGRPPNCDLNCQGHR
jgi:hypothetical protein